jgi:HD-like signal output (HDOD) protein
MTDKSAILDKLHQLPAMPQVVQEVMASFRDANAGSAVLAHKIAFDQGLSARVLRVANSSFYGLQREVGSIQEAVMVLGFDCIRSLVVSAGFMRAFSATAGGLFDRHEFWLRSFRVATYTEAVANSLGEERQQAFTAGMFHDVGQLVFDVCIQDQFAELLRQQKATGRDLIEVERMVLGFDHAEIGGDMAKRWNFPPLIEQAIRHWRTPEREPFCPVCGLVYVAVLLDSGLRADELMNRIPAALRDRMQLSWDKLEAEMPQPEELDVVANLMLAA